MYARADAAFDLDPGVCARCSRTIRLAIMSRLSCSRARRVKSCLRAAKRGRR